MNSSPLRTLGFAACLSLTSLFSAGEIQSSKSPYPVVGNIERLDPALDQLLAPDAKLEKLAEGFKWSEGPVWSAQKNALLFSDTQTNIVYRWQDGEGIHIFITPSGFTGEHFDGREPGSNGLTFDPKGRLTLAQHGNRQVAQLNDDGHTFTPLATHFEGHRFSSPNDLCFDHAGRLYFTDPPYGLPNHTSPEMPFNGVYCRETDGKVVLITKELPRPNGIALSPDQRTLYVGNSDGGKPVILAIPVKDDGSFGPSKVFFDMSELAAHGHRGAPDGFKVDKKGNVWTSGPGGILVIDPNGKHLGTIHTGQPTANCAFGGPDGSVLYITANNQLQRIQTKTTAPIPGT
ncbi:MAG TPA: SMP-30/gluconolactonase/LRE family protein [Opitutaceae bacterium]|nr:SMP-30/gluconolactonase/LRE family protein [Opitutaceae bacterium]